jgi:succinate dehydrogenase/fumarate reductase cytochrome b subunit
MFASGIVLLLGPPAWHAQLFLAHQASFFVWFVAMTVHVLGHARETIRLAPLDWGRRAALRGVATRRAAVVASLVVGAALAAVTIGQVGHYVHTQPVGHHLEHRESR